MRQYALMLIWISRAFTNSGFFDDFTDKSNPSMAIVDSQRKRHNTNNSPQSPSFLADAPSPYTSSEAD